jgi:hypothetical protein
MPAEDGSPRGLLLPADRLNGLGKAAGALVDFPSSCTTAPILAHEQHRQLFALHEGSQEETPCKGYFRYFSSIFAHGDHHRPAMLAIRANGAAMALVCPVLYACRPFLFHDCLLQRRVATGERYVHTYLHCIYLFNVFNSYYASKQCTYTDAAGRPVPAPRLFKPDAQAQQQPSSADPRNFSQSPFPSSSASNQFRIYSKPPSSHHQNDATEGDHSKHARKRFRNERGNPLPVDDFLMDGPIPTAPMDRVNPIDLDPALTRELTNCRPCSLVLSYST